jgi:hypothetical protein
MTAKRPSRLDLAKQARAILKRAYCNAISGAKKNRRYRRNRNAENKVSGRYYRAGTKKLGKLGAASPVRMIPPDAAE